MKFFRWVGSLFVPMFTHPPFLTAVTWVLHLLLVAAAAVGLYFVEEKYGYARNLGGPVWFRPYWLSALFLLGYGLLWQAWWVWRLMGPESQASHFPDLDDDWNTILDALDAAGVGIGDTPVFLVLGPVTGTEEEWLLGMPGGVLVDGGTKGGSAIRAFANKEMIAVTCPGVCLLGAGIKLDVEASAHAGDVNSSVGADALAASIGIDGGASIGMSTGGDLQSIQKMIRKARDENRTLSDAEKREIQRLSGSPVRGNDPAGAGKATLVRDPAEIDRRGRRLAHLCRLIAASRWPLCPVNGAVVAVPVSRLEREDVAQQIGLNAGQDLKVAEETLKLKFPAYALVTGLDTLPGATDFLTRFAADRKTQRLGKGYPLTPDLPAERVAESVDAQMKWVLNSLLPYWAFRQFHVERAGEPAEPATKANAEIFRFLNAVRDRAGAVGKFAGRVAGGDATRFGGCYLTARLQEFGNAPLFVDEFFKKVTATQGAVAWTPAAYAEDSGYRAGTRFGYLALIVLIAGVSALAAYVVYDAKKL